MTEDSRCIVAFAITEYQQNLLLAIAMQENLRFDVAFVRENAALNPTFDNICNKVVRTKNTPYSWRNAHRFASEFKGRVKPALNADKSYRVFAHSVQSPLVRLFLGNNKDVMVELCEDGTGSYLDWGNHPIRLGLRTYFATALTNLLLALNCRKPMIGENHLIKGWSLFAGCFQNLRVTLSIIETPCFHPYRIHRERCWH